MNDQDKKTISFSRRETFSILIIFSVLNVLAAMFFLAIPLLFVFSSLPWLFKHPFTNQSITYWIYLLGAIPLIIIFPLGIYRSWTSFFRNDYRKALAYSILPPISGVCVFWLTEALLSMYY